MEPKQPAVFVTEVCMFALSLVLGGTSCGPSRSNCDAKLSDVLVHPDSLPDLGDFDTHVIDLARPDDSMDALHDVDAITDASKPVDCVADGLLWPEVCIPDRSQDTEVLEVPDNTGPDSDAGDLEVLDEQEDLLGAYWEKGFVALEGPCESNFDCVDYLPCSINYCHGGTCIRELGPWFECCFYEGAPCGCGSVCENYHCFNLWCGEICEQQCVSGWSCEDDGNECTKAWCIDGNCCGHYPGVPGLPDHCCVADADCGPSPSGNCLRCIDYRCTDVKSDTTPSGPASLADGACCTEPVDDGNACVLTECDGFGVSFSLVWPDGAPCAGEFGYTCESGQCICQPNCPPHRKGLPDRCGGICP